MMDIHGQIAMEYLLLFFVLIIILSVISIPLLTDTIQTSNDITKAIETKSFLTEIEKNVRLIYSLDVGSKHSFSIYVPCDMRLYYNYNYNRHYITTTLTLSNSTKKTVRVEVPCKVNFDGYINNENSNLKKGWKYNTEVKWFTSSSGERSININFK